MERILKSARESGSLNLSNRSVSEVPGEVYNNLDKGSLDDKWWEGVDLQKLILAHNNLEVIREDLRNLSSLVVLNISNNQLSSIPATIGDLPLLKSLDVSFNQIKLIPEEVGLATALVKGAASSGRPRSQVVGSIFFAEDFLKNEAKLKKKKNLAQKSCRDLRMKGRRRI